MLECIVYEVMSGTELIIRVDFSASRTPRVRLNSAISSSVDSLFVTILL